MEDSAEKPEWKTADETETNGGESNRKQTIENVRDSLSEPHKVNLFNPQYSHWLQIDTWYYMIPYYR